MMDPAHQNALLVLRDLGDLIVEDDIADLWRFSFDGHPSPLHHWQLGLAMKWGAYLLIGLDAATGLREALEADRARQDGFVPIEHLRDEFSRIAAVIG